MSKVKRQKCTIYSRVVGYLSPLNQWNPGMKSSWNDRKFYKLEDSN